MQQDIFKNQDARMRKPKIICMVISLFVIWGLLYVPLKPGSHLPLPENLSWMMSQRDLNKYILPNNDTSILLPKLQCSGSIFLVVVVCSAVPNFEARRAIRNTWVQDARKLHSVQVFFLLGKSRNQTVNVAVANESSKYGDIIQQDFIDTYNNLTLKSVMLLKWTNQNCTNAKYVMKTDDDMFVNLPNLFRLLKAKGHKGLLLGCLIKGAVPVKDWNSKWFVPEVVFPGRVYPPYLSGTGYVMSRDAADLLYRTALSTPFFYLEDIFVTGICGNRVGLKPINNDGFKFYKRKNDMCVFRALITAHKMTPKELVQVWKNIRNPSVKCKS
ncbi:beta-1,3-galactosyltransferase 1-like [Stegodyphus dumicola]|uniref:beta-1,3-galactosyltransferase 1-like n=1 Tax=Stegodyphus dumicola TaxID=202533 RepID=UPI0015B18956|nr:beta-1,3-galactosyltransferase 1-like [Stegodyphus dumicola]